MNYARAILVIARGVWLEAVRRKDIYVLVLTCLLLIGATYSMDFFKLGGIIKFYREISLQVMGTFTAVAVVLLAVRQLPREFSNRTIYPLLARPLSRGAFIVGKAVGIGLAALFCYGLFMLIFIPGMYLLGGNLSWDIFLQHVYLQMIQMVLLTSVAFFLSLSFSTDAALTLALLIYFASGIYSHISVTLYEFANAGGRVLLHALNYALPQLALFDLSGKVLHDEIWAPLSWGVMVSLTVYAAVYTVLFGAGAYALFRRRPL